MDEEFVAEQIQAVVDTTARLLVLTEEMQGVRRSRATAWQRLFDEGLPVAEIVRRQTAALDAAGVQGTDVELGVGKDTVRRAIKPQPIDPNP